eukprot:SAG22_NODE_1_length_62449_cov_158.689270_24_plen_94_part_00
MCFSAFPCGSTALKSDRCNQAFLANHDVCAAGSTTNIGFHIRIPFTVNTAGTYHFRMHADYGNGAFIGINGPAHTPGNTWGMLLLPAADLPVG